MRTYARDRRWRTVLRSAYVLRTHILYIFLPAEASCRAGLCLESSQCRYICQGAILCERADTCCTFTGGGSSFAVGLMGLVSSRSAPGAPYSATTRNMCCIMIHPAFHVASTGAAEADKGWRPAFASADAKIHNQPQVVRSLQNSSSHHIFSTGPWTQILDPNVYLLALLSYKSSSPKQRSN